MISKHYRNLLRQKHDKRPWGGTGWKHAKELIPFLHQFPGEVLDYGCGRGTLKAELEKRGLSNIREYDPGIIGKDKRPEPAHLVVCTDVLEHVEPEYVDATLAELKRLTLDAMFLVISCRLAGSSLPDGRNTHLVVQSPDWWLDKVRKAGIVITSYVIRSDEDEVTIWAS